MDACWSHPLLLVIHADPFMILNHDGLFQLTGEWITRILHQDPDPMKDPSVPDVMLDEALEKVLNAAYEARAV